ncbi:MAG: outer membrane lipoprotein carrier protein LolA, partial [Gammaproteobacteria bacterium]|nr:outer membrane lipoprotein carrier protein LolA [Gammaproteobacteria bacterium]
MTSGIGKPSRLPLLAALLLGTSAGADDVARHRAWDLNALLTALAARTEGSARFSETRTLNLVTTPIRSSGRLYYRRPDILEKHVLSPREERLRIDGDRLTIEDGSPDSPRSVHLPDHPALLAAIESIRAPL